MKRALVIAFAPNDMRTLERLTEEREGYVSDGHLKKTAEWLIEQALQVVRDDHERTEQ